MLAHSVRTVYLNFGQTQLLGEGAALAADHVLVALEGALQFQELHGRECGAHAFRLAHVVHIEICEIQYGENDCVLA